MKEFGAFLDKGDARIGLIKSAPENIYLKTLQVSQSTESLIPALHLEFFQGVLKLSGCSSM